MRADSGDIDVRVRDARVVDAQTDSGDVVVAASARPRRIRAVTDSGNVRIVVPAGQYATTPKTDSGNVTVDGISRNDRARQRDRGAHRLGGCHAQRPIAGA